MLKYTHVHCQSAVLLLLAGKVILLLVLFGCDVKELSARVVVANTVLSKSNECIISKRAKNLISWRL